MRLYDALMTILVASVVVAITAYGLKHLFNNEPTDLRLEESMGEKSQEE